MIRNEFQGKSLPLLGFGVMRLPTLAKRLRVQAKPGLSNLLVGQCSGNDILQKSGLLPNLWVATAGDIPPNPAELLGSGNMAEAMKAMAKVFDVIILDLPPVTEVSDVLAVANKLDGVLLVVRHNMCNRTVLNSTVRQLAFVNAKVLGVVYNGVNEEVDGYFKKYYKRYYQRNYSKRAEEPKVQKAEG